jgi:phytoene synthase
MPPASVEDDLAACRALLRGGSRSFFLASLLLPRQVRDPASALYAFCRLADDAVDVQGGAVRSLRERLDLAYAGRPLQIPADRALAAMVARFEMPRTLPDAMLEGFAWDAEGRVYEELADVRAYAVRVAGAVGAMMAVLMGARSPSQVARACDLGVAMQLSNIARDVGEDARAGRLYLPRRWMREAGIDPVAWLANPVFDAALGGVVQRLLAEADRLYASARPGVARLPRACRPGIGAAGLLYREIGRQVARQGLDSVTSRAVVSRRRKLWLLARALTPQFGDTDGNAAVLPEASYLVEAAAIRPVWPARDTTRVVWLLELFERLERQQRERAANVGVTGAL